MWIWLLLFPVLEFVAAVKIAAYIGVWGFLNLLILSAMIGFYCLRSAGQPKFVPNQEPTRPLILLLAGLLFIFPGVISDFFALMLLIPFMRKLLLKILLGPIQGRAQWVVHTHVQQNSNMRDVSPKQGEIIDILPDSSTDSDENR